MIREKVRYLGCGFNKTKHAKVMKYCIEHGLDFSIYKLGPRRIKKMIQRRHGIELDIEGKACKQLPKKRRKSNINKLNKQRKAYGKR